MTDDLHSSLHFLLLQLASTWAMVGVIWTVQLVQYPGFARVPRTAFAAFHQHHSRGITWVVAPLMTLELLSAGLLVLAPPSWIERGQALLGLALVLAIWGTTACLQVPQHNALGITFDRDIHRRLVLGNWLRTTLWTLRGLLVLVWLRFPLTHALQLSPTR